jgi:hypothetical protein
MPSIAGTPRPAHKERVYISLFRQSLPCRHNLQNTKLKIASIKQMIKLLVKANITVGHCALATEYWAPAGM